ncbi:MAG: response regulator [Actinomycetota bacterium]|nr:response regulator [Actinomycetota bacterium]
MSAKAMVVDDAPDIRRLLDLVLSMAGYSVVEAASGVDAVRLLRDDPLPDVVLLDVQMPDLDGWETLERVRADPRTARLPVILCTVKGMAQDNLRAWSQGCDGFVTKPVDLTDLVAQVERVLALDDSGRAALRARRVRELSGRDG